MAATSNEVEHLALLHVIPSVAPRYGGASRAVIHMCRALQQNRLDPLIVTTDADGPGRLSVTSGKPTCYEGVRTLFFPRRWSESLKISWPLGRWLDRHVKEFDVVHIHAVFSYPSLAAGRACRRRRVPYVVHPVGTLAPWSLRQKRLRKQLLWRVAARRLLEGAAAVHYTTVQEQREAEAALGLERGVVVPLGLEEDLLSPSTGSDGFRQRHAGLGTAPYVLVLSRLHPKKGLEPLLDAFQRVTAREQFRDWRLVVAGDGEPEYAARLRRRAQGADASGRVMFTGWLDGADRDSVLRGAAVLALPSHQENFGLSVIEALTVGVPVLVSAHVDLAPEIAAAGAGWVTSLDDAALDDALVQVFQAGAERITRGTAGRAWVTSRFRWSAVAGQLVDLYRAVIARGRTGRR